MRKIIKESQNWELLEIEVYNGDKKVIAYDLVHKYEDYIIRRLLNCSEEEAIEIFDQQY